MDPRHIPRHLVEQREQAAQAAQSQPKNSLFAQAFQDVKNANNVFSPLCAARASICAVVTGKPQPVAFSTVAAGAPFMFMLGCLHCSTPVARDRDRKAACNDYRGGRQLGPLHILAGGFVGKCLVQGQPFELADLVLIQGADAQVANPLAS